MRILLVQSPVGRPETPIYPIGLAYLAGALKEFQCFGLDLSLSRDPGRDLSAKLAEVLPDVVAISVRNIDDSSYPITYWYLEHFGILMDVLKNWTGHIIVGGAGFSIYFKEIMEQWPRIDIGLVGEGEVAMPMLLKFLQGGVEPSWLKGKTAFPPRPCLDEISLPDYSVFPAADYPGKGSVGVQTRRGCVFNCAYCTYRSLSGTGFRLRPVDDVVADIRSVMDQGFDSFMFVDSVFDHPVAYYRLLLKAVAYIEGIPPWEAWLSESVPLDSLDELYSAGCRWVDFSPDVITGKGWKLMGKGGDVHRLWPAVKRARKAGLSVGVNFFSASRGENLFALLMKFVFMARARMFLGWRQTFINIGTIRLYRGARLSEEIHPGERLFEPVFYRPSGLADLIVRGFQLVRRRRMRARR